MDEWNLSLDQVSADNASNMVLTMELLESIRFHTLYNWQLKMH